MVMVFCVEVWSLIGVSGTEPTETLSLLSLFESNLLLQSFRTYCRAEGCESHVQCWLQVRAYRKSENSKEMILFANDLFQVSDSVFGMMP